MLTVVCLWVRSVRASGKGVLSIVWLWREFSLWRRDFVIVVSSLPSGAWRRTSLLLLGCRVISIFPVGTASRSGLIGCVVNVVCQGCHPSGCFWGMGGDVRFYLCIGAFELV